MWGTSIGVVVAGASANWLARWLVRWVVRAGPMIDTLGVGREGAKGVS